ncbi:MAG TPA: DUF934 domain-containing protein [Steroidobacteraceae bacterium]|nr:DUF934 domain-containing protein [Steroidobacteraceae bacterium]
MRQLVSIAGVVPDRWVHLSELGAGATATRLIVPWMDWLKSSGELRARAEHIGVAVAPETPFAALLPELPRLALLAIAFPGVGEGRGYSLGRQLRERGHFRGELRAYGEIFRDHVLFLARCGFDSFEISPREDADAAFAGLKAFSVAYQVPRTEPAALGLHRRQL